MNDIYAINGEPVSLYEQERLVEAEAVIAKFIDLETMQFNLKVSIETIVKERAEQSRFPHGALAKTNKAWSKWARDKEAQDVVNGWRVHLPINGEEYRPGTGIDFDGDTIPRVLFLPVIPDGALYAKYDKLWAAIAHHSLSSYEFQGDDGDIRIQSLHDGFHGVIAFYDTYEEAQEARNDLANALKVWTATASTPVTTDPVRKVREYNRELPA